VKVFILFYENDDLRYREFLGVYGDASLAMSAANEVSVHDWESPTWSKWTATLPNGNGYTIETHTVEESK
jgi:hypothetical protein